MSRMVILSGLSGSGKSTAVKVLEDIGFFCVDNLPPGLIPKFTELSNNTYGKVSDVAFVVDVREGVFFESALGMIERLKSSDDNVTVLFLEATDEVLVRRFKETRRKHPISEQGNILESIKREREKLEPIRAIADNIIDSSPFNIHQLRDRLLEIFGDKSTDVLRLNFFSFGFKYGYPHEADMVFDVRFLPNPHYEETLKPLRGTDREVVEFIENDPDTGVFIEKLVDLLVFLLPRFEREGKSYLNIAFGCTGGAHRSVYVAEVVAQRFKDRTPNVWHRDIFRN